MLMILVGDMTEEIVTEGGSGGGVEAAPVATVNSQGIFADSLVCIWTKPSVFQILEKLIFFSAVTWT